MWIFLTCCPLPRLCAVRDVPGLLAGFPLYRCGHHARADHTRQVLWRGGAGPHSVSDPGVLSGGDEHPHQRNARRGPALVHAGISSTHPCGVSLTLSLLLDRSDAHLHLRLLPGLADAVPLWSLSSLPVPALCLPHTWVPSPPRQSGQLRGGRAGPGQPREEGRRGEVLQRNTDRHERLRPESSEVLEEISRPQSDQTSPLFPRHHVLLPGWREVPSDSSVLIFPTPRPRVTTQSSLTLCYSSDSPGTPWATTWPSYRAPSSSSARSSLSSPPGSSRGKLFSSLPASAPASVSASWASTITAGSSQSWQTGPGSPSSPSSSSSSPSWLASVPLLGRSWQKYCQLRYTHNWRVLKIIFLSLNFLTKKI